MCVCACVYVCVCMPVCVCASVHVCMYMYACTCRMYMYNVHTCCWVYFLQHGTKLFQVTQTGAIFHHLAFTPRHRHHFMVIAHKVMLSCMQSVSATVIAKSVLGGDACKSLCDKLTCLRYCNNTSVSKYQLCYITCVICSQSTSSSALLLYTR